MNPHAVVAMFALAVVVWLCLVALYMVLLTAYGQRDKAIEVRHA